MKSVNVAIVGATGAVGEALVEILEQRKFPVGEIYLLASERSAGNVIKFSGKSRRVTRLDEFDFSKVQIGLFSAGAGVSAEFAPKAPRPAVSSSTTPLSFATTKMCRWWYPK